MIQNQITLLTKTKTHNGKRKFAMIQVTGPFCARCHKWKEYDELTVDHIVPRKMGFHQGKHGQYQSPENRQLLCINCQRMKYCLEHWFKNRIPSRKKRYLLFVNE